MSRRDQLFAVLVAVLWGLNFLAVHVGLKHFPPFFLAAMRYLLVAIPVLALVPRPRVPVQWLLGYGIGFGVIQFGLLFLAIEFGMPTGLASVVLQAGAPFTVLLGALLLKEDMTWRGWAGVGLAGAGLAVIAVERSQAAGLVPLALTVLAALGWALGSISSRLAKPESPLQFTLWMAVVPPLPLLVTSALVEGPLTGWAAFRASLSSEGLPGLAALAYLVVLGTIVSSTLWTALLKRHPASAVAPFSMLVPVVGLAAAWVALHETPTVLSLVGGVLVIGGVFLGTLPRRRGGCAAVARSATEAPSTRTTASTSPS